MRTAIGSPHGIQAHHSVPALCVLDRQRHEDPGSAGGGGHHRSRDGESRYPDSGSGRREAQRSGGQPAQPSLQRVEGHPEAPSSDLRPLRARVGDRARSRDRGDRHYRRQGRSLPPRLGPAGPRRFGTSPRADLSHPHLRHDPVGGERDHRSALDRLRLLRGPGQRVRELGAEAEGRALLLPAQSDDGFREARLLRAARGLRAHPRRDDRARPGVRRPRVRRGEGTIASASARREGGWGRVLLDVQVVLDAGMETRVLRGEPRDRSAR